MPPNGSGCAAMSNRVLAEKLVATLPTGLPGLFNPWRDHCPDDTALNSPDAKLERLARHLDCDPVCIGVGEAAGYMGMRHSAVAFTSERLLMDGSIPACLHQRGVLRYAIVHSPSRPRPSSGGLCTALVLQTVRFSGMPLHCIPTARTTITPTVLPRPTRSRLAFRRYACLPRPSRAPRLSPLDASLRDCWKQWASDAPGLFAILLTVGRPSSRRE